MLFAPLFVIMYFGLTNLTAIGPALFVGIILALLVHIITKDEEELPAIDMGTK